MELRVGYQNSFAETAAANTSFLFCLSSWGAQEIPSRAGAFPPCLESSFRTSTSFSFNLIQLDCCGMLWPPTAFWWVHWSSQKLRLSELSEVEMTASNYGGNVGVRSKLSWLFLHVSTAFGHLVFWCKRKKNYLNLLASLLMERPNMSQLFATLRKENSKPQGICPTKSLGSGSARTDLGHQPRLQLSACRLLLVCWF